jgi:hypothetical protein
MYPPKRLKSKKKEQNTFVNVDNVFVENVAAEEPVPHIASSRYVMRVQHFGHGLKTK